MRIKDYAISREITVVWFGSRRRRMYPGAGKRGYPTRPGPCSSRRSTTSLNVAYSPGDLNTHTHTKKIPKHWG